MPNADTQEYLRQIVLSLPDAPGCYQYLDASGTVIYVGKAKNLKRRVSSYFNKEQISAKTRVLVSKIRDIKYVVVKTEQDALLLEKNLIKRYKQRYNVLLKDDKTYPSIAVTNEYLPRIFKTRRRTRGATYFGPYSHLPTMYALLDLCHDLYQPRPCKTIMTQEGVENGKYEVCLDYHIHRCKAPCVGKQTHEEYVRNIAACCKSLIALTPESVSISIKMSRFCSRKVLFPASFINFARSSTGGRKSFCTMRTLCISRGSFLPLKNVTFAIRIPYPYRGE